MRQDAPKSEKPTVDHAADFAASIDEARTGSREAIGRLIDSCRAYLLLVANTELDATLRAKVAASDLVQETLLAAHAEFSRFRGQSEPELLSWLRRMLLNDLTDLRRKYEQSGKRAIAREERLAGDSRTDRPKIDVADDGLTPRTDSIAREEAAALQKALARLPDDYRQAVMLRNWERLSFVEIGKQMNRSPEAVRKLWTRAIERLQDELRKFGGDTAR